jgi:hypothetical protein
MPNENVLEGFKCPKCGSEGNFKIEVCTVIEFNDEEGAIDEGADKEWQPESFCACVACDHAATVKDFQPRPIPPDPEGKNDERSAWGEAMMIVFRKLTGTDREDALSDMLCDLHRWADRNGQNFDTELARAKSHYREETTREG